MEDEEFDPRHVQWGQKCCIMDIFETALLASVGARVQGEIPDYVPEEARAAWMKRYSNILYIDGCCGACGHYDVNDEPLVGPEGHQQLGQDQNGIVHPLYLRTCHHCNTVAQTPPGSQFRARRNR